MHWGRDNSYARNIAGGLPLCSDQHGCFLDSAMRSGRLLFPADIRRSAGDLPPAVGALVERLLFHRPEERPRAATVVQQLVKIEIAVLGWRRTA